MSRLTHLDQKGEAHMVDVGDKAETVRVAVAEGHVVMQAETLAIVRDGEAKKGDVLGTARLAGIMAAKRTADLIPLCHPLPISAVEIDLTLDDSGVAVRATVRTAARTGVEMEAMTAVSVALLTIYDMAKAVDKAMTIRDICLLSKEGGKSGPWTRPVSIAL